MSPRRKSNRPRKTRVSARSKNTQVVVARSVRKDPPDYNKLARVVVELAKDMREAKELGITVEELRRERWSVKEDR